MEKQAAAKLIKDALQNPFDRERFVYFIKNLLNRIDESKAFHARGYVPEIFKDHVKTYERIGTYTDPEDNKTDILVVYLQKEAALDRARTTQRNFIARYLKDRDEKDAGLIAFVAPDEEDWRFSFVKMEYRLAETPTGRIKAEEEFTPARRYSYLVGKNENSHTAQSRLVPILEDDKNSPTLAKLEEAFSIEKVTKEFFEKYRDLFMRTKEALDEIIKEDEEVKNNFHQRGVNTVDFSKKLLGQIVFLYFLQKKGWFGVARDASWGTGPKNFLRLLFEKRVSNYQNFFNDILEPLFYEALAIERQADFYSRFNCKIPFLNGGLFDPINSYDWVHTDVLLPDELFSNGIKTKEGDIGIGILDVFDRYNFTVKEDEPLEKEVAVDPEMLGKVFENLLEVKDRKSKGTYYTPREIVHYMCQESLINYLDNVINTSKEVIVAQKAVQKKLIGEDDPEQLGIMEQKQRTIIPKEDIESFIRHGISAIEHDRRVEAKGYETRDYSYRMPDSIRLNARLFDNALQAVKICDPAVGSGAFLVGMMHEIIRARETLTTYLGDNEKRTPYNFKHHSIQNCLYGVDIDQGAVEIAKLRLWLSLMVDEEDIKHIKPLPNLDYKIVCGNSLLGINDLFHHAQLKKLEELKGRFFEETNSKKKSQLKDDIDHLISEITHDDKHFDFKVYFSEVFNRHGGFNVVIGNPPYGADYPAEHKKYFQSHYESAKTIKEKQKGSLDTFSLFIDKGLNLANNESVLSYIVPMAVTSSDSMTALHNMMFRVCETVYVSTYSNRPKKIFDSADQRVAIIICQKNNKPMQYLFTTKVNKRYEDTSVQDVIDNLQYVNSLSFVKFGRLPKVGKQIELSILDKLYKSKTTLADLYDENGKPIYYRSSGGRYYNIVTNFSSGSTQEKSIMVKSTYGDLIAAVLSSNLYYWFLHIYSDNLHIKSHELEMFPIPIEDFNKESIATIEDIYKAYLKDLHKNSKIKKVSYAHVSEYREYYARCSKHIIDKIDTLIKEPYGLTDEEINFIINYDLKFRTDDEDEDIEIVEGKG